MMIMVVVVVVVTMILAHAVQKYINRQFAVIGQVTVNNRWHMTFS